MRSLLVIYILLSLLYGCGPATTQPSQDQPDISPDDQAQELFLAGNFSAAAEEYLILADQDKRKSVFYKLKAAEAYIAGDNPSHAKNILSKLDQNKMTVEQFVMSNIVYARIALLENNAELALTLLSGEIPDVSSPEIQSNFHEVRALAFEQNKQYMDAATERIIVSTFLEQPDRMDNNYKNLWMLVYRMDVQEIDNNRITSSEPMLSWLELAIINKTIRGKDNLTAAVDAWSQKYPDHPALKIIIPEMIALAEQIYTLPKQVALLLPLSSEYRDAAKAIQSGFMAAWYAAENNTPIIKVYDADEHNILEVYQLAVDEGAEFIIGPLAKDAVTKLVESREITIRTMVLNQYEEINESEKNNITDIGLPSLIRFALSPEDEARQVAERAWFDGHANALVITPANSWGERIFHAFNSHWEQLGGKTLKYVSIEQDTQDYSVPIELLLNINNSEQRAKLLRSKLNRKIYTETRRRQDADFIFMAAMPVMGRQLIPQIRYHRADDLSVYSISNIYSGINNKQADSDINNVTFADMPWVTDPELQYSLLQITLNDVSNQSKSAYRRLYALGIDAYRLIPRLGQLAQDSNEYFEGVTGRLKLGRDGKIIRQLTWVKFIDGEPQLIDKENVN